MGKVLEVEIPIDAKDFVALVRAVDKEKPTAKDRDALADYLVANPKVADAMGNLVYMATGNLIKHSFSTKSVQLSVVANLRKMRDEMGFEKAGAVERSLIEHVCLCWLRLYDCELRYHVTMQNNPTFAQGKYWEGKLSANQRRYLRAVETLERVRKLMRPDSPTTAILMQQNVSTG